MSNSIQILKDKLSEANLWENKLQFKREAYIKRANTIDTHLYFLETGCVRVYFTEDAYEHTLYFGYKTCDYLKSCCFNIAHWVKVFMKILK